MKNTIKRIFSWFKRKPKEKKQTPSQRVVNLTFEQIDSMTEPECEALCSDLWRNGGIRLAGAYVFGTNQNDSYQSRLQILNGFLRSTHMKEIVGG